MLEQVDVFDELGVELALDGELRIAAPVAESNGVGNGPWFAGEVFEVLLFVEFVADAAEEEVVFFDLAGEELAICQVPLDAALGECRGFGVGGNQD